MFQLRHSNQFESPEEHHSLITRIAHEYHHSNTGTIFGCVALAFSDISLYVKFFFWMYFAVAIIGCMNGLLLLPVLLAWAGPSEFDGNPTATAKVSDVFSEPEGTSDTKTKHSL